MRAYCHSPGRTAFAVAFAAEASRVGRGIERPRVGANCNWVVIKTKSEHMMARVVCLCLRRLCWRQPEEAFTIINRFICS